MYKDPSEFRERFKAYKEGKSVREIYGLPEYQGGKLNSATKKKIDYYYKLLINNGFDQMSAVGILGNMMQESSFNPDSINQFGYKGLLQNSKEIQQAIINQYGDHSEQSQLRYLSDWTDGSTWVRKGPHAKDTALYSKSYLRKGYKTPEEAAFQFLKRYERAIVVDKNTKQPIRDKNGNYVYQDKDKRLNYARQIYNYLNNIKPVENEVSGFGKTYQQEPIINTPDATRVVTTIPQEKAIDYTDKRNTVGAAIDRSIWAHQVMQDINGMAYDVPIWESKSLPALEPVDLDVTPFKTYEDGKVSQGNKQIPIDKARAWAMHHDADESWYERYGKNVADAVLNTVESFTEPYRNVINGRLSVNDAISIGLDAGAGIGAKAISRAARAIKPTKASISLKGKTPRELAQYFEQNPDLIVDADPIKGETPEEASRLFSTYTNSDAFLKAHPEFAQLQEDEAINTQLRSLISQANGGVKGKELDSIIDNMPYDKFETYAILANAYTNDMAKTGGLNRNTYKNTLKYVGATYPMLYAASQLRKHANGKLPGYEGGKTIIGSNVQMNDDGTFTDDYTKVFDDIVITQNGTRVKQGQLYKYQKPWNDEEFINAVTVGGLNNLSPAQWIRRGYDLATGNLTIDSWLNGNAGVVPNSYAEEHPLMSMVANGLVDFWTLGGPKLLKGVLSTGTKLNPVQYTKYEPQPVQKPIAKPQLAPKQFEIEEIPGYQLKSLMRGNALEKQLSKQGTISVNSIRAHANKASDVEKSVIDKILSSEEFAGQKSIDYNRFRKAVHDDLITYNVIPDAQYADYGIERLGFNHPMDDYRNNKLWEKAFNEAETLHPDWNNEQLTEFINSVMGQKANPINLRTFTFESPRIPVGNNTHYNPSTLGHSRAYFTQENPNILHIMESQSDWAQQNTFEKMINKASRILENPELLAKRQNRIERLTKELADWENMIKTGVNHDGVELQPWEIRQIETEFIPNLKANIARDVASTNLPEETVQPLYLSKNYTTRQIQENLKYAAEHGQTKMRYPTPDTAAKIEGYKKGFTRSDETEAISKQISDAQNEYERLVKLNRDPFDDKDPVNIRLDELVENLKKLRAQFDDAITRAPLDYSSEHKTILKKYADFPKQFKKLHKNAEVREVTDGKGNTWYEVDVPKNFLNKEWMYGIGAMTIGGAATTASDLKQYNDGKIAIKPSKRGTFTAAAKKHGASVAEFERRVLKNPEKYSKAMVKKARFSHNARSWKH